MTPDMMDPSMQMPPQGGMPPPEMGMQQPPMGGPEAGMMPPEQGMAPPVEEPMEEDTSDINKIIGSTNLVEGLLRKKDGIEILDKIADEVIKGYEKDLMSRKEWDDQNAEYMKLACQVMEDKNYPWPKASNVKFPILTTAALQFSSRAYPSLVSSFDVVKAKAIGNDPNGEANGKAQTISTHMSYQLLYEMQGWEEDMDKLCFILPIIGTAFKKTYYDPSKGANCSELVLARDLVVDYWAKNLECAYRKTHRIYKTPNEILGRQREGIYIDNEEYLDGVDLSQGGSLDADKKKDETEKRKAPDPDSASPRLLLECHTFFDMDDDGYDEPYCITIDYESKKILRIVARFYKEGVVIEDGKIVKITPCEYFTKFGFIPNPDGGFYDLGFGLLLGGINDTVNTLINQLVDAGTLSNLQGGFISKGIRLKQGDMKVNPGQWVAVNNFGDDLKKGFFPLPVKEPSNVLFQLLGTMAQSGKELASISEIFTGKMPGQNTPASTTMATIEQGLKVFTSIYKRIYRAMGQEFEKLYFLNKLYLPEKVVLNVEVAGEDKHIEVAKSDYNLGVDPVPGKPFIRIVPAADPNMVSDTQKLVKAQGLLELVSLGTINVQEATRQILEQQGQANIKKLMEVPPPQPDPEIKLKEQEMQMKQQAEQAKMQHEKEKLQMEMKMMQLEMQIEQQKAELEMRMMQMELQMKAQEHQMEMKFKQEEHQLDASVAKQEAEMQLETAAISQEQDIRHSEESHKVNMEQQKAKAAQQAKAAKSKPKK